MAKTDAKTGASFEDLATAFKHGRFAPLYFLYGEESFLMDELQALALRHALAPHEHDFNYSLVYGAESSAQAVLAQCAAFPMMAERRLVVVRSFEKLPENKLFQGYAAQPNPHAVVLLLANGKPNATTHPYRALKQHAVWAEFSPLKDNKLPGWVEGQFKAAGVRAESGVAQMLAEVSGPDLRTVAAEVNKLITFASGRPTVTRDDVIAAAGHSREANPFALQAALTKGDTAKAITILTALLAQSSNARGEAIRIVALLSAYLTKLWKLTGCLADGVPERELARQVGVSPYYLREYVTAATRFGPVALVTALRALLAADYELKGGSERDERLVIMLALMRCAAPRRQDG